MNVLLVHNFYQRPGGEDVVFHAERDLLLSGGHQITTYTASNDDLKNLPKITMAARTVWNAKEAQAIAELVQRDSIEIVHFHNTFPLLSPAVYSAVRAAGAVTVQTLHNYRLMCANALFFRDGHICEACLGQVPWPAVRHRCYRDSVGASAAVVALQMTHRILGTYRNQVDAFITLTEFARGKFIEGGLPADRLFVKPNFLNTDPGMGTGDGKYALFIGRLSEEKGVRTLLEAWRSIGLSLPLKILGDGPLAGEVASAVSQIPGMEWLGHQPRDEVLRLAGAAECLILPSECYEGFPMTIVEAYAVGLPVIASKIGAMNHLIEHERTGLHFIPGNAQDLAAQVASFQNRDQAAMRHSARSAFLNLYSREKNLDRLLEIYDQARQHSRLST